MKILIIGGTGNISRWLVPMLVEDGHDVTLYNRGYRNDNVKAATTITGDRTNHAVFEKQIAHAGHFDCVIDMVGFEPEDARSAVRAFTGKVGQFIFCSTVDVFAKNPAVLSVTNAAVVASPSFAYAYKKVAMEKCFNEAHQKGDFPLTIIRPAATYSEGWSPLVTCFGGESYHLDRLQKKKPVILHGDGSAIWVAAHSIDVASAFRNAVGNPKTIGKAYTVSGEEIMTWQSMHRIVAEVLGNMNPEFIFIPTNLLERLAPRESEWCVENFQYSLLHDNGPAKQDLNFRYTIPFREGSQRCISHLQERGMIDSADRFPFYDELIGRWNSLVSKI